MGRRTPRWAQCCYCPTLDGAGMVAARLCWGRRAEWGSHCQNIREEPIHILNIALRRADHAEDEKLVPIFRAFAQSKVRLTAPFPARWDIAPNRLPPPWAGRALTFSSASVQKNILVDCGLRRITFLIAQQVSAD